MAKMKVGQKSKNKQPKNSYAVSVSMAPAEEKEPEIIERIIEVEVPVEKIVEKEVRVEVPVRLGDEAIMKDCTNCTCKDEMAAKCEEINDMMEDMSGDIKIQDRRVKEIEIEIDRELTSQMSDLQTEMQSVKDDNEKTRDSVKSLEKAVWGLIGVSTLILLIVMST